VWYFRIVPTLWYFGIVPTAWYFRIGIIHRFSRLVTLLFHKWLHVRLKHQDACISRKLNDGTEL
jgi:hypothetical protein